jgi:hypothetical protein
MTERQVMDPQPPAGEAVWMCPYSSTGWALSNSGGGQCGCSSAEVSCPFEDPGVRTERDSSGVWFWVREFPAGIEVTA